MAEAQEGEQALTPEEEELAAAYQQPFVDASAPLLWVLLLHCCWGVLLKLAACGAPGLGTWGRWAPGAG